jgi:hypothetical protein
MDNRLDEALTFANYRLTLQIQRQNITARTETALVFSYQSAIFKASIDLIGFVDLKTRLGGVLNVEDQSGNVITIKEPAEFLKILVEKYDFALNMKQEEQQKLKSARTTAKVVGL